MDTTQGFKLTDDTSQMLEMSGLVRMKLSSKNVNEDFVLKTISNFFNQVRIDGEEILNVMPDDLCYAETWQEIIKIINLESALSSILKHLFIKDFTVNDIINPGAKRINKCLRYLSNFLIYYSSKMSEMNDYLCEMNEKRNKIQNLIDETKMIENKIIGIINKKEKMLTENEKMIKQIEEWKIRLTQKNKQRMDLQKTINDAREKHEINKEMLSKHKSELIELQKFKADLEKKLVKSPSKINDQIIKLNKLKELRMNEISNLKEIIIETNKTFDHKNKTFEFIKQLLEKCQECCDVKEKYTLAIQNGVELRKKLNELKELIERQKKNQLDNSSKKHYEDENLENLKLKCKKKIEALITQRSILKRELMISEKQIQTYLVEKNKIQEKKNVAEDIINKLIKENENLMIQYKEFYLTNLNLIIKKQEQIEKNLDK